METAYARQYKLLYEKHWWWRARESTILSELRKLRSGRERARILDVGCGDGLFFDRLSDFGEVEGVELDAEIVSAAGKHRDSIHVGPFDASFLPPKPYSLILMLDVLEHMPAPVEALRHALNLLDTDGRIVITVPAFDQIWTNHDVLNRHQRRYTKRSFAELARQAGLRIDEQRYFFQWLFPLKLGVRLIERSRHSEPALPRIPAPWLNQALYLLSRLEAQVLPQRWLPFGSSLLIIGSKPRHAFVSPSRVNALTAPDETAPAARAPSAARRPDR